MTLTEAVAKRIKELLFEKNLTQYKLAKKTCLSQNCFSNLLNGKTKDIKFSTIYLAANFLTVSMQEFFDSPLFDAENIEI